MIEKPYKKYHKTSKKEVHNMAKRKRTPARSPEGRENQMISDAFDLAERKLRDGTASSQLIVHFLKLATTREQLENEKLRSDLKVADAKVRHMESQATSAELYEKAINAFKSYAGVYDEGDDYADELE